MENFTGLKSLDKRFGKMGLDTEREGRWKPAYLRTRAALKLGFNLPRKRGFAMLMQYNIITVGVDVFGVNQQPVHVE